MPEPIPGGSPSVYLLNADNPPLNSNGSAPIGYPDPPHSSDSSYAVSISAGHENGRQEIPLCERHGKKIAMAASTFMTGIICAYLFDNIPAKIASSISALLIFANALLWLVAHVKECFARHQ